MLSESVLTQKDELLDDLKAYQQLQQYTTALWYHPLLTEQTRRGREDFKDLMRAYMEPFESAHGLKWVAIPAGSSRAIRGTRTNTYKGSDQDGLLITNDGEVTRFLQERRQKGYAPRTIKQRKLENGEIVLGNQEIIDLVGMETWNGRVPRYAAALGNLSVLLVTPDELCIGDIPFLNEIRFTLAKAFERSDMQALNFWIEFTRYIQEHIAEWNQPRDHIEHTDYKTAQRYLELLTAKGFSSPDIERRTAIAFNDALNSLPPKEVFANGLRYSKGALTTMPEVYVDGINETNNQNKLNTLEHIVSQNLVIDKELLKDIAAHMKIFEQEYPDLFWIAFENPQTHDLVLVSNNINVQNACRELTFTSTETINEYGVSVPNKEPKIRKISDAIIIDINDTKTMFDAVQLLLLPDEAIIGNLEYCYHIRHMMAHELLAKIKDDEMIRGMPIKDLAQAIIFSGGVIKLPKTN